MFLLVYLPVIQLEEQHLRRLFPEYATYAERRARAPAPPHAIPAKILESFSRLAVSNEPRVSSRHRLRRWGAVSSLENVGQAHSPALHRIAPEGHYRIDPHRPHGRRIRRRNRGDQNHPHRSRIRRPIVWLDRLDLVSEHRRDHQRQRDPDRRADQRQLRRLTKHHAQDLRPAGARATRIPISFVL